MFQRKCRGKLRAAVIAAAAVAVVSGAPAGAVDPILDPMRPPSGPTANTPSPSAREILHEAERAPSLTERFGLPRLSGPLPPILPPPRPQPVLDTPLSIPPPPVERARRSTPEG